MTIEIPKGGKGQIAPYQTTHIRIVNEPELVAKVKEMSDACKKAILAGEPVPKYQQTNPLTAIGVEDAKQIARQVIKGKKSATQSIAKLLSIMYDTEINPADLK